MAVYSYSRLSTYESCPLKYKFHYLDKMSPEEELEGVEAFLGSRFHETMEWLYKARKLSVTRSLEEALEYYTKIWRENWHEGVQIVRKDFTATDYFNHGRKMIENYYARVFANEESTTIALEKLVFIDVGEGIKLRGYVDRLARAGNGVYEIHDYKTSAYLPTQKQADEDKQLAFYQMAVQNDYKDAKKVKLVWHYTAFNSDVTSVRKPSQLSKLKAETIALVRKIERAEGKGVFPAQKSALCDWCGFRVICPAWKHIARAELMTENQFSRDTGVQLATKFAGFKEQERELGGKIEELRGAITSYAKKEGVETIAGKDCAVNVKTSVVTRLPARESEEREQLDSIVIKAGKWRAVSELSHKLLSEALEGGVFDDKTAKAIEKLEKTEEETRVTVSKKKE